MAKCKSLNIWNNKMLKINSCSKSAIVTAIFNERAELLPRDQHCNVKYLPSAVVQFESNITPWDFTRYKESTEILHANTKRQHALFIVKLGKSSQFYCFWTHFAENSVYSLYSSLAECVQYSIINYRKRLHPPPKWQ